MDQRDEFMKIYKGILDPNKMNIIARKAYISYTNQKSKCENVNNPDYKYYGKKKIKVIYKRREFIAWYMENYKKRKWIDPTTGRIDHDKDYSFDNIKMQERKDNSQERIDRLGPYLNEKKVIVYKNNKLVKKFKSLTQAALYYDLNISTVVRICQNKYRSGDIFKQQTESGLKFKYYTGKL